MGKVLRFRQGQRWFLLPFAPRPWRGRSIRLAALAVLIGGAGGYLLFDVLSPVSVVSAETMDGDAARAYAIVGKASVIDGDTIEIHGTRIRLHGIDAPESDQLCVVRQQDVRCGQQAAIALYERIGRATVSCEPTDRDRYGRVVAVCRAHGEDLNASMRSEEHTSELQSLMRISYAVFCLKKKTINKKNNQQID